jgi:transposase
VTFLRLSDKNRILVLWDEGKNTAEIADIIGVHESVVYNTLAQKSGTTEPAPEKRTRSA